MLIEHKNLSIFTGVAVTTERVTRCLFQKALNTCLLSFILVFILSLSFPIVSPAWLEVGHFAWV